jgi:hypothetical protein
MKNCQWAKDINQVKNQNNCPVDVSIVGVTVTANQIGINGSKKTFQLMCRIRFATTSFGNKRRFTKNFPVDVQIVKLKSE